MWFSMKCGFVCFSLSPLIIEMGQLGIKNIFLKRGTTYQKIWFFNHILDQVLINSSPFCFKISVQSGWKRWESQESCIVGPRCWQTIIKLRKMFWLPNVNSEIIITIAFIFYCNIFYKFRNASRLHQWAGSVIFWFGYPLNKICWIFFRIFKKHFSHSNISILITLLKFEISQAKQRKFVFGEIILKTNTSKILVVTKPFSRQNT